MPEDIRTLNMFQNRQNPVGGGFYSHVFHNIISLENLLESWKEFVRGKRSRKDVQEFGRDLMRNVISLHTDLSSKSYRHSDYHAFNISDPKPRNIHKASVRDRLLHHAIYRVLYPYFDKRFIYDSYSCRLNKGTHKALERFKRFGYKVSKNNTRICWVLKCDIKKFFASIDQKILIDILRKHIKDSEAIWLIERIIYSFDSGIVGKGLPLGNLTSQLLVNIYMNEFDQFVKHELKVRYYIRYANDFVILQNTRIELENLLSFIVAKLDELKLTLHPNKVSIKTLDSGVDLLGWVHFPHRRIIRTVTKNRMLKNLADSSNEASRASYQGLLKHGNTRKILNRIQSSW